MVRFKSNWVDFTIKTEMPGGGCVLFTDIHVFTNLYCFSKKGISSNRKQIWTSMFTNVFMNGQVFSTRTPYSLFKPVNIIFLWSLRFNILSLVSSTLLYFNSSFVIQVPQLLWMYEIRKSAVFVIKTHLQLSHFISYIIAHKLPTIFKSRHLEIK